MIMDDHEVAIWITGYRRRVNESLRIMRQGSFWTMLPHVKTNSLESAKSLGALPDEDVSLNSPVIDREKELAMMAESWGD